VLAGFPVMRDQYVPSVKWSVRDAKSLSDDIGNMSQYHIFRQPFLQWSHMRFITYYRITTLQAFWANCIDQLVTFIEHPLLNVMN